MAVGAAVGVTGSAGARPLRVPTARTARNTAPSAIRYRPANAARAAAGGGGRMMVAQEEPARRSAGSASRAVTSMTPSRASRMWPASRNRSWRSAASAFATSRSTSTGTSRFTLDTRGAGFVNRLWKRSIRSSFQNGSCPVRASNSITPSAYTSDSNAGARPRSCCGDRYAGVPRIRPASVFTSFPDHLATPKSATLYTPGADWSTLSGLMSRCRIPRAWAASSAAATWWAIRQASFGPSGPDPSRARSVGPCTYS